MNNDIKTLRLPEEIITKILSLSDLPEPKVATIETYEEANRWFELGEPKMKMNVILFVNCFKGTITDVSVEKEQSIIIEVMTPPGKTQEDCWNALFNAGIDEVIRRNNP